MKIFGLEITRNKKKKEDVVADQQKTPSVTAKIPVAYVTPVRNPVMHYGQTLSRGRGQFIAPEYDLTEIGVAEDVDSFLRQSFSKKLGLMFKEGFDLVGPNIKTLRYCKTRFAQVSRASGIPFGELLQRTARSLIRTSNAFWIKVRDIDSSGGSVRLDASDKEFEPVAAYFPAAPETMRVEVDQESGRIVRWRQELPDGRKKEFPPSNVIHFYIDRREGFLFGVPISVPVLDDIRALRQIEENIEMLLYQHLFPLFHWKVGTETSPAGITEDGFPEVEVIQTQVANMPAEGGIVTSERHEIHAVGAEGRALRAEGYLTHFKRRVFSGLGVSSVDFGEADTANRATARVVSQALVDSVKSIQDSFEVQFNQFILSELLLESTFGSSVLNEENLVHLRFNEIDVQNKIEQEQHASEMFGTNGLTFAEFRAELGREPIEIPDDPHDQDMSKFPEWSTTAWKLFKEPEFLIKAIDEPWSPHGIAASEARSTALTAKGLKAGAQAQEEKEAKAAAEERKTKVAVARARPKARKDNFLRKSFSELESDTIERIRKDLATRRAFSSEWIRSHAMTWAVDMAEKVGRITHRHLVRGFNDQTGERASEADNLVRVGKEVFSSRANFYLEKLVKYTVDLVVRRIDAVIGDVKLSEVQRSLALANELHAAFDSVKYRLDFLLDVESRKAYNYGRVLGMRFTGSFNLESVESSGACERCENRSDLVLFASAITVDDTPPYHPGCRCKLKVVDLDQDRVRDEAEVEDQDKMERCVLKVKQSLRKKNPGWSEKRVKSAAHAICNKQLRN
jgi:hypothetical protein